jgi:hypothetical protein
MQDLIERLAAQAGIDPALSEKATAMIVGFVSNNASPGLAEQLRQYLPNFDALAEAGAAHTAAASAGDGLSALGGLFSGGGIAGALGGLIGGDGPLGEAMALIGHLGRDGIDLEQIRSLASGLLDHLRANGGSDVVDRFLAEIPGASHLLG